MKKKILLFIAIFLLFFITPSFALIGSEVLEKIDCNVLEEDPDFLLNIIKCDYDLNLDLTFNPDTIKNTLTGWFNITDDQENTVFSQEFIIKKSTTPKIPFTLNLTNLKGEGRSIKLKWGTNSSTVSVTENTVYRVTSGDNSILNSPFYSMDFQKSSCTQDDPCGGEVNMTIFNTNIPDSDAGSGIKAVDSASGVVYLNQANSSLVEYGPARVVLAFENKTGNLNSSTFYYNWSEIVYAYPQFYQSNYRLYGTASFTYGYSASLPFGIYFTTQYASNNPRFDEWNNRTKNGTNYQYSVDVGSGSDTLSNDASASVMFLYDDADHNKTVLFTITDGVNYTSNRSSIYQDTSEIMYWGFFGLSGTINTKSLGYLVMFGRNGLTTVANNQTVWDNDFNEQYQAWYKPATLTSITGTQKGRNNKTGSYNFSANGTLADFNFTTISNQNYTYPVFEIENISNITNIIGHVYIKNYTASSTWTQLTNYTDFVIQEGNSSWFGYDYVVLLLNKTLGRETASSETYEIWISNVTSPEILATTVYNATFQIGSVSGFNMDLGTRVYARYFTPMLENNNTFSRSINLTNFFNIKTNGSSIFSRNSILQILFNVATRGSVLFEATYLAGAVIYERIFEIGSLVSNTFTRNFFLSSFYNIENKGSSNFIRNTITSRIIDFNALGYVTFEALLVEVGEIFERFFNIGSRGSSQFNKEISLIRFLNIGSEASNQFVRSFILDRYFNPNLKNDVDLNRNFGLIKTFSIATEGSLQLTRSFIISRISNIATEGSINFVRSISTTSIFNIINEATATFEATYVEFTLHIFERVFDIVGSVTSGYRRSFNAFGEALYTLCVLFKRIGLTSNVYLCVHG